MICHIINQEEEIVGGGTVRVNDARAGDMTIILTSAETTKLKTTDDLQLVLNVGENMLFGFPIIWTENTPVGDVILTDWLTYLKFKKKAEEYKRESE